MSDRSYASLSHREIISDINRNLAITSGYNIHALPNSPLKNVFYILNKVPNLLTIIEEQDKTIEELNRQCKVVKDLMN